MIYAKAAILIAWTVLWWLRLIHRKYPDGGEVLFIAGLAVLVGFVLSLR